MPRRHFLKQIALWLSSLSALLSLKNATATQATATSRSSTLKNTALKTLKSGYSGNPIKDGLFINPYTANDPSANHGFGDILKWRLSDKPYKAEKEREKTLPGLKVIHSNTLPATDQDYILWLGHASFLIQIDGKRLLTDPCLTAPPMFTRHTELPLPIDNIQPDYLLISHGHYDHLDSDTLKHCNHAKALIPLKMTPLVQEMNPTIECQEAGWYQQYTLAEGIEVIYLPANHWYRRTPFDKNEILWGSFLIKTPSQTLYFAGDTGYAEHFKEIKQLFGKIDIAFLPIGAYEPRWFMKASHMNPQEALQAYRELDAGILVPMHYGTFDLTDEPLSLPPKVLKENTTTETVRYLTIGETWFI